MEEYKELYFKLFHKITDVIGDLQSIQTEAEELLLSRDPEQEAPGTPLGKDLGLNHKKSDCGKLHNRFLDLRNRPKWFYSANGSNPLFRAEQPVSRVA